MTKKCVICGNTFETKKRGAKRKYCFSCSPYYSRNDKNGRANTITALRKAIKAQLVKYKGGKCNRCGYNKCIGALQFHHIDETKKDFEIADYSCAKYLHLDELYKEVDKCILLCANCHAEEHEKLK